MLLFVVVSKITWLTLKYLKILFANEACYRNMMETVCCCLLFVVVSKITWLTLKASKTWRLGGKTFEGAAITSLQYWAVVVAQLVEWSLLIPEVRSSNQVIGKYSYWTFTENCIEKTKIKKKRTGMAHFLTSPGYLFQLKRVLWPIL